MGDQDPHASKPQQEDQLAPKLQKSDKIALLSIRAERFFKRNPIEPHPIFIWSYSDVYLRRIQDGL